MTQNTVLSSRPIRGFFQQAGGRAETRGTHKCPHWSLPSSTLIKTPLTSIFLPAFLPTAHSHLSWHLPVESRRMKSRPQPGTQLLHTPPTRANQIPTHPAHLLTPPPLFQSFPPSAFSPQRFGKCASESSSTVNLRSFGQILTRLSLSVLIQRRDHSTSWGAPEMNPWHT